MSRSIGANFEVIVVAGLLQLEEDKSTHYGESSHGQKDEAPLQELIEGESEEIESKIDLEERVGDAERSTVTKPEVRIPLRGDTDGKDDGYDNCRYIHHEQNQPGAEIYIDSSGGILGGFDNLTGGTLSHEIPNSPRCDAEVNPQKEKRRNCGHAKHYPLDRE